MKKGFCLSLFIFFLSMQVSALPVKLKMPNGLVANANYHQGDASKPAVFLLHGFLQTHSFSTISRLYDSLSNEEFTVFSPTLTLGIPDRKQSLACEALHDHTMADDVTEIDTWIQWLKAKGYKNIILMGHSQGSTSLLNYLTDKKPKDIQKFIAVSILEVNVSEDSKENQAILKALQQTVAEKSRVPQTRTLSFCTKYMGTPQSFLSYQQWSTDKILDELKKLKTPVKIIMGSGDTRIKKNWINELKTSGKPVAIIDGANHFMDGFNEFDLLEIVLQELNK